MDKYVYSMQIEWKETKETLSPLRRSRVIFHVRKDFMLFDTENEIKEFGIISDTCTHVSGFLVLSKRHAYSFFTNKLFAGSKHLQLYPVDKVNPIALLRNMQRKKPWWLHELRTRIADRRSDAVHDFRWYPVIKPSCCPCLVDSSTSK